MEVDPVLDLIATAKAVLAGQVDVLIGAQRLSRLLVECDLHPSDEYFRLSKISNACAALPLGPERVHWNAAVLERKDEEIARLTQAYRRDIEDSCLRLLAQFE